MSVLATLNKPAKAQGTSFVPSNVIDCARTARSYYTPEFLLMRCRVIEMKGKLITLPTTFDVADEFFGGKIGRPTFRRDGVGILGKTTY